MSETQFFVVWNPVQGMPTKRHENGFTAKVEAERLAGKYPGQRIYVLQAIGSAYAGKPAAAYSALEV